MTRFWSRRAALQGVVYLAAGAAAGAQLGSAPAHARTRARRHLDRSRTGVLSRNGWEMEKVVDDRGSIYTRPVPGTPVSVPMRIGDVEIVLVHVIRRFHYEIDALDRGDVVGWRPPDRVAKERAESNQASGTAVQIRPGHYPPGARGGFYPQEQLALRDVLAELGGVVRWGGDDPMPDESLFSIDVRPGDPRLAQVVDKLRLWEETPGAGAGTAVDVLSPTRRKAALELEQRQKG